jgi:sulfide:quinone oxidoreductase
VSIRETSQRVSECVPPAVADDIPAKIHCSGVVEPYHGTGSCHIEVGAGLVGKVDADCLSGPTPKVPFLGPTTELAKENVRFAATRRRRWFGT